MKDKFIGFIGCDKYDIIMYLSRILYQLGKKVLLMDYSENQALYQSIAASDTLKEVSTYIHYSGIDFIQGKYYRENQKEDYDYVLIDFGYDCKNPLIPLCKKILFVTDLQLHNMKPMSQVCICEDHERYLIIKDVFPCKIKPEFILDQLSNLKIKDQNTYVLYQDPIDMKYRIQCQYNQKFSFPKLSKPTKAFLQDIVNRLEPDLEDKALKKAYRMAERGK